jgi:hypothetical protein
MCWSAPADLTAGSVIVVVGAAGLTQVRRRGDLPLALLPVVLGAHQLIESQVWSGVRDGTARGPWVLAWAVIAFPLLPVYLPAAVLAAQHADAKRRLLPLLAVGVATSAVLAWALATRSVHAHQCGPTLRYAVGLPLAPLLLAGYVLATCGSLLASADRSLRLIGAANAAGAAVTGALFTLAFASTWCLWAAFVSLLVVARLVCGRSGLPPAAAAFSNRSQTSWAGRRRRPGTWSNGGVRRSESGGDAPAGDLGAQRVESRQQL